MFLQIQSVSQLGYIFVSFVSERACVISVTFFKCSIAKSGVGFLWLWGDDLCLIDNVPHITISFKWARILDPAITLVLDFFWWIYWFANLSFIVAGDNGFYFTHAAIAQLKMNKKLRATTPNSINCYPFHSYIYIYLVYTHSVILMI